MCLWELGVRKTNIRRCPSDIKVTSFFLFEKKIVGGNFLSSGWIMEDDGGAGKHHEKERVKKRGKGSHPAKVGWCLLITTVVYLAVWSQLQYGMLPFFQISIQQVQTLILQDPSIIEHALQAFFLALAHRFWNKFRILLSEIPSHQALRRGS